MSHISLVLLLLVSVWSIHDVTGLSRGNVIKHGQLKKMGFICERVSFIDHIYFFIFLFMTKIPKYANISKYILVYLRIAVF